MDATETQRLRDALEEIADPIAAIRKRAEAQGRKVDGAVAVFLSNDPNYLKGIARSALETR